MLVDGLQPWAFTWTFNYDPQRFVQDGKNGDHYYIYQFADQIPELTDGLTAAGLKAISESIRAYTIWVLSAQLFKRITIIGTSAAALDAKAEFVNALKAQNKKTNRSFKSMLSNASSHLKFALAPGLHLIPQDFALKTDSTHEYNDELFQVHSVQLKLMA